jgi:2-polyprenyl-3-methyl-5-hydroxy-6-metoxy-1,4-benzoquinol methylase
MDRTYWEKIAPAYNDEIFDVLLNDRKAIIRSAIKKFSSPAASVIDIGCAVGKWLPILAPAFKKVFAVDISAKNLSIAEKNHSRFTNIKYLRLNMSAPNIKIPQCDLAVCINAILTPSLKNRQVFFRSLSASVKKGGHLILVTPSLESYLLTSIVRNQWNIDRNLMSKKLLPKSALAKWKNILHGNADIDDVPTKHFLREEIMLLLGRSGFIAESSKKIEYGWDTEFLQPPVWLKNPYPWDWMCIASKS